MKNILNEIFFPLVVGFEEYASSTLLDMNSTYSIFYKLFPGYNMTVSHKMKRALL